MEQIKLPKDTATLVLGIVTIVLALCCQPIAIITGILAWVFGNQGKNLYEANPDEYLSSSFSNIKTGRLLGMIGLALAVALLLYQILVFDMDEFMERYMEMMETMGAGE